MGMDGGTAKVDDMRDVRAWFLVMFIIMPLLATGVGLVLYGSVLVLNLGPTPASLVVGCGIIAGGILIGLPVTIWMYKLGILV